MYNVRGPCPFPWSLPAFRQCTIVWRRFVAFPVPSMFVNRGTSLILFDMPWENVDSCCWMYSLKDCEFGDQRPIFSMALSE